MVNYLNNILKSQNILYPVNLWAATEKLSNPDFTYKVINCLCDMITVSYNEPTRGFIISEDIRFAGCYWAKIHGETMNERSHALFLNFRVKKLLNDKQVELHNISKSKFGYNADVFLIDSNKEISNVVSILKEEKLVFDEKPKMWKTQ